MPNILPQNQTISYNSSIADPTMISQADSNPSGFCCASTTNHPIVISSFKTGYHKTGYHKPGCLKGFLSSAVMFSRIVVMVVLMLCCTGCATKLHASTDEPIIGKTELSFEQISEFILQNNPDFDPEIAKHYVNIGKKYGIRAEIAIAQAILETGWFEFKHSNAVKKDHHNYCGLGVTSPTTKGCCFDSAGDGVTAHIQHLFAYATDKPLPQGETLIDPRFKYVKRACAPSLSGLTGTWAMSNQYSKRILDIYNRLQAFVKDKGNKSK